MLCFCNNPIFRPVGPMPNPKCGMCGGAGVHPIPDPPPVPAYIIPPSEDGRGVLIPRTDGSSPFERMCDEIIEHGGLLE